MKKDESLDFLVLGAPKAGTTSLYEWLRQHPEIFMPEGKELPLFTNPNFDSGKAKLFFRKYYKGALDNQILGKATPHYLCGQNGINVDVVAHNIWSYRNDFRFIVVLRHPVERAYSDYKMAFRRGYINESFEVAVDNEINRKTYRNHRAEPSDYTRFVVASEYGRLLRSYLQFFDRNQFHIMFTDSMRRDPESELNKVLKFLGVDSSFIPDDIRYQYHQGGIRPKSRLLTPGFIYKIPLAKKIWRALVPEKTRQIIEFKINQWNIAKEESSVRSDSKVFKRLVRFYEQDVKMLSNDFEICIPWDDFDASK